MWIWILLAPVALVLVALAYRAWRQSRVAERLAIRTRNGVQETGLVSIGGIRQWVSIRGEDRANPVLIIAHGGPGGALLALTYEAFRPWEAHFTVVQWDQRGAGLTFSHGGPKGQGEVSLDRIAEDGLEVAAHAASRLGQLKVILLGISWGSAVGVRMVRRRPELFHAYVGTGQVVDMQRNEAVGYAGLMDRVRAAGDARDEQALIKIGPPPYADLKLVLAERRVLRRHPSARERGAQRRRLPPLLFAPGLSLKQTYDYVVGASAFSLKALSGAFIGYSDPKPYAPFELPVVFIQGAEDIQTPTSLVEEYFAEITAPRKALLLLPGGGHMAVTRQPQAFLEALLTQVRPLTAA